MAPLHGGDARATEAPSDPLDLRFDPATPLTLALGMSADASAPMDAGGAASAPARAPALDEVPALIMALLGRTEPALSPIEQRVLRACLRLAGERLPLVGGLDADFYEALLAFKGRHDVHPLDARLDLPTLTLIVRKASIAVGGPYGRSRLRRLARGVWFDVTYAPALVAEAPGIVSLIRELKGGRTRTPTMAPLRADEG